MSQRILDVTANTTLDFVDAAAHGPGWRDEGAAVLDVRTPTEEPERVTLDLELDPTIQEHTTAHAETVSLTAEQARTVASALEEEASNTDPEAGRRRG